MAADVNWKRLLLFVPLLVTPASVSMAEPSPELIKASYILNFQKFVNVGNPPHMAETMCYYERHGVPLEKSVGQLLDKYVKEHPYPKNSPVVKKFEAIRDLRGCDIFYIPAEEEGDIDNILNALGQSSTLTVSAADKFIVRGGMIGLIMDEDNHIKMEANLGNIKAKGVHVDAGLLEVMLHVINQ